MRVVVAGSGESIGMVLGGRYLLVGLIGKGASGDVYLAQDKSLGRKVAIKLLHANLAGDPVFTKRFRAEATSAAALNHPSVMRVFDWGESNGTPYLVLEYLSGGSLREYLAAGKVLDAPRAAALSLQVAQGLAYAHSRGYVHRDMKPANLLFDEEARVRIADFGLARSLSESAWTEPIGVLIGTAKYASPEQAKGLDSTEASDVYSTGLIIYESMSGKLPFVGDTTLSTLMARVDVNLKALPEHGKLSHLIESCCRAEPEERITAASLVSELESLVRVLEPPRPLELHHFYDVPSAQSEIDKTSLFVQNTINVSSEAELEPVGVGANAPGSNFFDLEAFTQTSILVSSEVPSSLSLDEGEDANQLGEPETAKPKKKRSRWWMALWLFLLLVALAFAGAVGTGILKILPPAKVKIPAVAGATFAQASSRLKSVGLTSSLAGYSYSKTLPKGEVISESPAAGVIIPDTTTVKFVVSKGPPPVVLPRLEGISIAAAESVLRAKGLKYTVTDSYSETVASGIIISSSPNSATVLYGSSVSLVVSKGPAPRHVPNLVGSTAQQATSQLGSLGLIANIINAYSDTVTVGTVMSTNPSAGQLAAKGSTVTVTVSQGPHLVQVPNVLGDTISQAQSALTSAGLTVANIYGPPGATHALGTGPSAGTTVRYGSPVNLYVF